MKKYLVGLFVIGILCATPVFAQEIIEVGNAEIEDYQIPMNDYWQNSITETVYDKEWINTDMYLHTIGYHTANVQNVINPFNIEVWIGEVDVDDLSDGWVDGSQLTMCYDGIIDVSQGTYWLDIELDTPFEYENNDNLVIMVIKDDDEYYYPQDTWWTTESGTSCRTLHQYGDSQEYSAMSPPSSYNDKSTYPDICLYYYEPLYGNVDGTVTDINTSDPIEGANVSIGNIFDLTDPDGYYLLEDVLVGPHSIRCSAAGYHITFDEVEVLENQTVTKDFELEPLVYGSLEGTVIDDSTGLPIENASIHAITVGDYVYNTTTDLSGYYLIPEMVAGTYYVICHASGYGTQTVDAVIEVGETTIQDFVMEVLAEIVIVCDLGQEQMGTQLVAVLENLYEGDIIYETDLNENPLDESVKALFILLGTSPFNHVFMETESAIVTPYLDADGCVYMEGGDTWFWDNPTSLHPYFNITPLSPFGGGIPPIYGVGSFWDNMTWGYVGDNSWITEIVPNGDAELVMQGTGGVGVAYESGTYKTVGCSFEITDMVEPVNRESFETAVKCVLAYFDLYEFEYGSLEGYVTELSTSAPIEGAIVHCGGYEDITGPDGYYLIEDIVVGTYNITCEAIGYNDILVEGIEILADQTTNQDFAMTAPTMEINPLTINESIEPGDSLTTYITVSNNGNGPLDWCTVFEYPGIYRNAVDNLTASSHPKDVRTAGSLYDVCPFITELSTEPSRDTWDLQFSFDVLDASGGPENTGAEFDGTYFYSTRWNSNLIHKYDINGNLVEEFSIPGISGIRDLAWDGEYLYGSTASNHIYGFDPTAHTLVTTISTPVNIRGIAYDSNNDGFWCTNSYEDIYLVDRDGITLNTIINPGLGGKYGLAYDNVSGGPYLWIFDQGGGPGEPQYLLQLDIATGELTGVSHDVLQELYGLGGRLAGGLFITTEYQTDTVTLGGLCQGAPDIMFCYELCPYASWISLDPVSGIVEAGSDSLVAVTFDGTGIIPQSVLNVNIEFISDPDVGTENVDITLQVGTQEFGSISGTVTLENSPYSTGNIECVVINAGPCYSTSPDTFGNYTLPAYPNTYNVTASLYGYEDSTIEDVVVVANQNTPNIDFDLNCLFGGLTGYVTDFDTGLPIEDATVTVLNSGPQGDVYGITDVNGHYEIGDIVEGVYYVEAIHNDYNPVVIQGVEIVQDIEQTQDFVLQEVGLPTPRHLIASEDNSEGIELNWWLPEGFEIEYDIIYDDSVAENAIAYWFEGDMRAVRFTPASYPCGILKAYINIYDGTWPEGDILQPFEVAVFDDDGSGGFPCTELGRVTVTPTHYDFIEVDLSALNILIESGDFYIAHIQGGDYPDCAPTALDETEPTVNRSYDWSPIWQIWLPSEYQDFMIRARVNGPEGPALLTEDGSVVTFTSEEIDNSNIVLAHPGKPKRGTELVGNGTVIKRSKNSRSRDFLNMYNVYRSNISGGPYTLLAEQVPERSYLDTDVALGQVWYYITTALYDTGTPYEESPYSNEDNGSLFDAVPPAPDNVCVTGVDDEITISWDEIIIQENDIEHYNIYMKYMIGAFELIAETTDTTYDYTLLDGEGLYKFYVTAVDLSGKESDPSETVDYLYGNLPPLISATSGVDECIPIHVKPFGPAETHYILDDGTCEWGVTGLAGEDKWIGNQFPVTDSGELISFEVYSIYNEDAGDNIEVEVDIFDADRNFVGSSESFVLPADDWVTVASPYIPFDGEFYAMIHFNCETGQSNYLGMDMDGPYANSDLGWVYEGAVWTLIQSLYWPGVGMIRATAWVEGEIKDFVFNNVNNTNYISKDVNLNYVRNTDYPSIKKTKDGIGILYNLSVDTHNHETSYWKFMGNKGELTGYEIYKSLDASVFDSVQYIEGGEPQDWADTDVINDNEYWYYVIGIYGDEESDPSDTVSAIPHDGIAPSPITDLEYTVDVQALTVDFTWLDPVINEDGTPCTDVAGIQVYRDEDLIATVEAGVQAYSDVAPAIGTYLYSFIAFDEVPNFSMPKLKSVCVDYVLFVEDFSMWEMPPEGWSVEGDFLDNWRVFPTNTAGGELPEGEFYWLPDNGYQGTARLVTPVFNTTNYELTLEFKYYINHYCTPYTLGVATTSDGGVTWNDVWSVNPSSTNQEFVNVPIETLDVGSPNFQLCFYFDGDPGNINSWDFDDIICRWTEVGVDDSLIVLSTKLNPNFPNPFSNSTTISFSLKEKSHVKLSVYNIKGQLVATLLNDEMNPGKDYKIIWSGKSGNNRLANGIYFYKLETRNKTFIKKMILMR